MFRIVKYLIYISLLINISMVLNSKSSPKNQFNVFGEPLQLLSLDPITGYYRDGYCHTGPGDTGSHTVAAVISQEFLDFQKSVGNDLSTPMPMYNFPGLKPGNKWAVCALRWLQAYKAGKACRVILAATNKAALRYVPLEYLKEYEYKEENNNLE
jgi:uncharacterized protein